MSLPLDFLNNKEDGESSITVESLTGQEVIPLGNDKSNTDRAALAAIASKKPDVVSMYKLFKDSLDINADDQPVKDTLKEVDKSQQQITFSVAGDMLVDPAVPDGVKAAIPAYLQRRETPDPRKVVAEQSLAQDNYVNGRLEGANQEAARLSQAKSWVFGGPNGIDAGIQNRKDANVLVQAMAAKDNDGYWDQYFDLMATFTPGHGAVNTAAIRDRVGALLGEDPDKPQNVVLNFFTQFSNKREMRDMIKALPPDQQMKAIKQSLDIIQDVYGPGVFDGNGYAAVEAARQLLGDKDVAFSSQSKAGAVVTDTLFNLISMIGVNPSWLKPSLGILGKSAAKAGTKHVPKVVFSGEANPLGPSAGATDVIRDVPAYLRAKKTEEVTQAVDEVVAPADESAAGGLGTTLPEATVVKAEPVYDVDGTYMSEPQIAERRTHLSAMSEEKFSREDIKQLRSEQAAIGDNIEKLEAEKVENNKNGSQLAKERKTSRKNAVREVNKVVDEQIEEQKAKLSGIKDKLAYSERGYRAEADLSRFEQAVKGAKQVEPEAVKKSDVGLAVRSALDDAIDEASAQVVVGGAKPSSVISTIAETNPSKASTIVKAAIDDETGELAKVTSGTSRGELANDSIMPSPGIGPVVRVKPTLDVDTGTLDLAVSDSGIRYTDTEIKSLHDNLVTSITGATDVKLSTPLSQLVEDSDNGFRIKGLFIDGNVGFNDPIDALERTLFALKHEGISGDSVQLMERTPSGYAPVGGSVDINTLPKGDYAVQVDHHWNFKMESGFEKMDIKRNWLDWWGGLFNTGVTLRQGTLTRHIFSPQHVFHKNLMLGVIPAFDKAAGITKRLATLADEFNKPFGLLSKAEQKGLADYIHKANVQRIPFHAPNMIASGYTHDQVNVMANWKRYWDTAYVLENVDKVRTLQLTGHKMFLHKATGAELFVKPQGRNAAINGKVYDPDTDTFIELTTSAKKDLYDNGGTVAMLRDHVTDASGDVAKYVIVKNNTGSYYRDFNNNDMVLNYINGYYSVRHEAPLFVVQNVRDKSGRILYKKAIAEAGSIEEAESMAKSVAARTQGHTYLRDGHDSADFFIRKDVKTKDAMDLNENRFDVGISSGRSSQRFRGAVLESYDPLASGQSKYVQNPLEAMQQTAFSLGNRLATRATVETLKARYMDQYADLLTTDSVTHMKGFPTDPRQIGFEGALDSKRLTDARTMWEYINQLEHGYTSAIDGATRGLIGIIADGVARIPVSPLGGKGEAALRSLAGSNKITSNFRAGVYYTSLVAAHMGTFLVQSAQSLANLSLSFMDYRLYRDLSDMLGASMGIGSGKSLARGKQLWNEFAKTGHKEAIDIHGAAFMGGAGSSSTLGGFKASRGVRMASSVGRLIQGFYNKGELVNQYTAWLAKRLDFERVHGRPPSTQRELDQIHAEGRLLTYNMNRSGQMAYNENTLNIQLQFFQVMHKALFDPFLTRDISARDFTRLTVAPLMIFGVPLGVRNYINGIVENTGLTREQKDAANTALEFSVISKMLSMVDPGFGDVDYARFNPFDPKGFAERIATLYTYPEMFTRNPVASFVEKGLTAIVTTSRFIGLSEADTGIVPTKEATWRSIASILSGTSNMLKGSVIAQNGVFIDKYGQQVGEELSSAERIAQQFFGFIPGSVQQTYNFNNMSRKQSEQFKEDVDTLIKNATQQLALNGVLSDSPEFVQGVMGAIVRVFGDNEKAMDVFITQLKYDMRENGESSYLVTMMKASGWKSKEDLIELGVMIPSENQRKEFLGLVDQLYSSGVNE